MNRFVCCEVFGVLPEASKHFNYFFGIFSIEYVKYCYFDTITHLPHTFLE